MGVTIKCKRSKTEISLGCGGFYNLRKKVAELCCPEFAEIYQDIINFTSDDDFEWLNQKTEELIAAGKIGEKIVDFCFQSDSDGKISYMACKEIYNYIKDYDDNICYGYAGIPDCAKFKDFVTIIEECCLLKSSLVWY